MDDVLDTMVAKEPFVMEVNVHTNASALAGFVNPKPASVEDHELSIEQTTVQFGLALHWQLEWKCRLTASPSMLQLYR